jgi:hypothetical protein
VYGELSLSALAAVLCEHADAVTAHGTRGAAFVDLGAYVMAPCAPGQARLMISARLHTGSGTGKSVLLAALCPFIASATVRRRLV